VGIQQGLRLETRYVLGDEQRDSLLLEHTLTRVADGDALNMVGAMVLHPGRAITPYSLSTTTREYSLGFDWLEVDRSDEATMLAAMQPGDLQVLMGADGLGAPVSYGLALESVRRTDADGESSELSNFLITASDYTLFGVLSETPWFGSEKPGVWDLLQSRFMDLEMGESLSMSFRISVKRSTNITEITDQHYQGAWFRGRILTPEARLLLSDENGSPLTTLRHSGDGNFKLRLPEGVAKVNGRLVGSSGSKSWTWTMIANDVHVGNLALEPSALLALPRGHAMRLTFVGIDGTPNPRFNDDYAGANSAGEEYPSAMRANYLSLSGGTGDAKRAMLPAGKYRVYASRGLEFSVTEAELTLQAGQVAQLEIEWPLRVVETPDQVSADLHVHSGVSFDSALPLQERVRSFAAAGAEYLVASEHNRLIDYRQLVADMGLQDEVHLIPGVEFTGMAHTQATPETNGHANVFPLTYREREFSGGMPAHEGVRLRELIQWTREQSPEPLFQLNHPRVKSPADPDLAYFDHLGIGQPMDPKLPLTAAENSPLIEPNASGVRDADFDLLEMLNGHDMDLYSIVRADWFSLLRQGLKPSATANSDSHESHTLVAVPTNYVSVDDAASGDEAEQQLLQSLRDMLQVVVQAAPWLPVDTLTVYLNGVKHTELAIEAGDTASLRLDVNADAFVVVEVSGKADQRYSAVLPGFQPLAFTNPIWIDADADGQWQPPGL
jgi:hypothetical protein